MGRDHHGGARCQRLLNGRHRGTHAGVFGDIALIVLRDVEVGSDENTFAGHFAFGDQIGETQYFRHGSQRVSE